MADLTPTPPAFGLTLPSGQGDMDAHGLGHTRLAPLPMGPIWSVAPYPGQAAAVAARLGGFPGHGQVIQTPAGPLVWAGRAVAFLFGAPPDLAGLAALTDQSDGWAGLRIAGEDAADVLARLIPLDLAAMAPGTSARSVLNHLPLLLIHPAPQIFDLWSYRSMAGTLAHDLCTALTMVAARKALP